jgi:hypothetical protein
MTLQNINLGAAQHIESEASVSRGSAAAKDHPALSFTRSAASATQPGSAEANATGNAAHAAQPVFEPSNFVKSVNNEYFPLQPGATYIYEGESAEGHEFDRFMVSRNTVNILGVECIEVIDLAYVDGELVERTRDWFAQDKDGNVWYFGEATQEIEDGQVVNTEGSWKAGVNGAQAGIVMLADPETGDTYRQEFAPGVAEDMAKVIGDEFRINAIYGNFDEVLKTKDFTPLEPGKFEHKFYAEGIGQILTINPLTGQRTELVRIEFNGLAGDDLIRGKAGRDLIRGLDGNDMLAGREGNDTIMGGKGDDVVKGGAGDDELTGGLGSDTFVFSGFHDGNQTTDTITGYRGNQGDKIDLGLAGADRVEGELFFNGAWQLMLKGDGDIIRLIGVKDANHDGHIVDDLNII